MNLISFGKTLSKECIFFRVYADYEADNDVDNSNTLTSK